MPFALLESVDRRPLYRRRRPDASASDSEGDEQSDAVAEQTKKKRAPRKAKTA